MSHGLGGDPAPGLACVLPSLDGSGNLTDSFAGLTVKNTFIDIKFPGSPTDSGSPPTVTAPAGMAGMHRLFGKVKKTRQSLEEPSPALEAESSLGPQPPAILEDEQGPTTVANLESADFPGAPMRVLPDMEGLLPANLTVKNTFIGIKSPPTSEGSPPTVTAPPGMAGVHRLFGKVQLAPRSHEEPSPALEAASSLGTQPPAMLEGADSSTTTANSEPTGSPMRVLRSMASERGEVFANCATSSSSPPPGLTSRGSALHSSGDCSPCAWFWKPTSCSKGADCARCHSCPDGELKRRKKNKATSGSSGPAESSLGQTKLASVPKEPAYVVCATSDQPVTFEDDFPQSTKVTVGAVPVKNTFINFDFFSPQDDADASSPPTVSAPGALLTRLFKTRPRPPGPSPFSSNPMEAAPCFPIPIPPFIPAAPTPWRPPGILTDTVPFAPHSRPPGVLGPTLVDSPWPTHLLAGFTAAPPMQAAAAADDHYKTPQDAVVEVGDMNNAMSQLHLTRDCTPCNYFYYKVDGCRQGSDCQFCHLCPKGEIKKRKKEKVKMLKSSSDMVQKQALQ